MGDTKHSTRATKRLVSYFKGVSSNLLLHIASVGG
jgi:hypothetical protein